MPPPLETSASVRTSEGSVAPVPVSVLPSDGGSGELQSRTINMLRFPLIVGVLLIHTRVLPVGTSGGFYYLETLLSRIIGHVSVPLFFFISGYLFFYKTEFSGKAYLDKIQRRTRTLLFPYVFWISAWIALYFALVKTGFIWKGVPFDASFITHAFWDYERDAEGTRPFIGQFWFLRDLMCAVVLSPLIYWGIRKMKWFFVVALGVLWLLEGRAGGGGIRIPVVGERGMSYWVLFFFSAGAWFSVNKQIFTDFFFRWQKISFVAYPVLVVVDLFSRQQELNWIVHRVGIFVGVFFFVNLVVGLLNVRKKDAGGTRSGGGFGGFLFSASFFVYAAHGPGLLLLLNRLVLSPLNPQNDWMLALSYFLFLALELLITLVFFWVLRRFFPVFTRLITGGRGG
jgi:surface polysaccharide O-acyltransferase-like enzyme